MRARGPQQGSGVFSGPSAVFSIFSLTWWKIYLFWTNLILVLPPVNFASFIRCSSVIELHWHALPHGRACVWLCTSIAVVTVRAELVSAGWCLWVCVCDCVLSPQPEAVTPISSAVSLHLTGDSDAYLRLFLIICGCSASSGAAELCFPPSSCTPAGSCLLRYRCLFPTRSLPSSSSSANL